MADIKEPLDKLTYPAGPWIEETRVKLGQGHYGTVYAVKIRGLQCAGKKFVFEKTVDEIGKRFVEQCLQLAQIRHPNIVQLLGIFFDIKSVPTVVSEVLPLNLAKCLDDYQHMPKYAKSSILLDVANGLRYAHEQKQPMVHGRLCAEKILLTISLQAKICGFVNPSEVVLPDSSYNAPEVAKGSLTVKGDVFSFGNLVLHVATQAYPQPTSKEKQDPADASQTVTCSETERREQSLKLLGESHALQGLVRQCLEDDPSSRPTTAELLQEVEQHAVSTPPPYASVLQVMQEVEQATLLKENIAALTQVVEGKQTELDAKQLEIDGLMQELDVKEKTILACKDEIETYKQTVQSKDRRMMMHDQALRAKDSLIKAKAREIVAKNQQLSAKDSQLAASNRRIATLEERLATGKAHGLRFPTTPQKSPSRSPAVTRSQQVSPTFKESPYKFSHSAEAEDLAARAGEVLRRSVPGRRGKTVPMSDGIFFQNAKFEPAKSGIYGQQPVDPKLAAILARRHQRYENTESQTSKNLEPGQQTKAMESTSGQAQLRKQQENQRSRSSSASSGMSPELQKMMDRRRSQLDVEQSPPPVPQPPEPTPTTTKKQRPEPTPPPVPPRPVMPNEEPIPPKQPQHQDPSPSEPQQEQDPSPPEEPQQQDPSHPEEPQQQDPSHPEEPQQQQDPSHPEEPQQQDPATSEEPQQHNSAPPKEPQQQDLPPPEQQDPAPYEEPKQQNPAPPEEPQQHDLEEPLQQDPAPSEEQQQQDPAPSEEQQQQDPAPSEDPPSHKVSQQDSTPVGAQEEQVSQDSTSPSENQHESLSADLQPQLQESDPVENGAKETEV